MTTTEEPTAIVVYGDLDDDLDLDWLVQSANALTFHVRSEDSYSSDPEGWIRCSCESQFSNEDTWRKHVANEVAHALFEDMEQYCFDVNEANGWHEDERKPLEGHALITSEVAEATEAHRMWNSADMTGIEELHKALPRPDGTLMAKPLGAGSEYADIVVRVFDQTRRERDGNAVKNLFFEFKRKVAFNRLRGYKHGGKLI